LTVYGAASAVGAYTLKLAKLGPRFSKIIAVCGTGRPYVESLNVATHIVDYKVGNVVEDLRVALDGDKCYQAVDTINNGHSSEHLSQVLDRESSKSKIAVFLPRLDYSTIPTSIAVGITFLSSVHGQTVPSSRWLREDDFGERDADFAYSLCRLVGRWLHEGKLTGHPFVVRPNGLASVEEGLWKLKAKK
jgi:NADPH2:quinone reductase